MVKERWVAGRNIGERRRERVRERERKKGREGGGERERERENASHHNATLQSTTSLLSRSPRGKATHAFPDPDDTGGMPHTMVPPEFGDL